MAIGPRKALIKISYAIALGLLVFVLIEPANAQTRKKAVKPALPRTAEIVSEANGTETPKVTEKIAQAPTPSGGAYGTSLRDLVALRTTELSTAEAQKTKMEDLFRDGLVSKKSVDEAADAIVEARAKLEDAKMRLASIDNISPAVEEPDLYVDDSANTAATSDPVTGANSAGAAEAEHKAAIKKTAIIYPRRKSAGKRKTH
jgi:hypothetical protein